MLKWPSHGQKIAPQDMFVRDLVTGDNVVIGRKMVQLKLVKVWLASCGCHASG